MNKNKTLDNLQLTIDMFRTWGQMSDVRCQMRRRPGQSLIEVVIALAVVVGLAVALLTTTLVVQKASRTSKNNSQATKLVQQNNEQIRILRDRQGFASLVNNNCWVLTNTGDTDPNNWKLANSSSAPPVTCPELVPLDQALFNRSLKVEDGVNTDQKKVTVTVSWTDSGGTRSVSNQTILSREL